MKDQIKKGQDFQLIHEFRKNSTEVVKVERGTYMNSDVINIRVYYKTDTDKDYIRRSRKGLCMRVDLIPELKKAIDKAYSIIFQKEKENIIIEG